MKKKLTVDRMIELEYLIKTSNLKSDSVEQLLANGFLMEEISYMLSAIKLPKETLEEDISNFKEKNVLKLVSFLSDKYNVDAHFIWERLGEIEAIDRLMSDLDKTKTMKR